MFFGKYSLSRRLSALIYVYVNRLLGGAGSCATQVQQGPMFYKENSIVMGSIQAREQFSSCVTTGSRCFRGPAVVFGVLCSSGARVRGILRQQIICSDPFTRFQDSRID